MSDTIEPRVQASFDRQGLMHTLGGELLEASQGRCRVAAQFDPKLTQQHGLWHGAVTAALADTAAGFAAFTLMSDRQPLAVEFKISFVAPARGKRLVATADVVANGHRLKHVRVEVTSLDDGTSTVVALALATIAATRSVTE